jgi:HEAT repeat protein
VLRAVKVVAALLVCTLLITPASAQVDQRPTLDQTLAQVAAYEFGSSREPLSDLADFVREATNDESVRSETARKITAVLTSDATTDCKRFLCRQLALIGGDESVDALAALLDDPALSHMARYALEVNPSERVTAALIDAMDRVDGELLVGVVNSIGRRRGADAIGRLMEMAVSDDEAQALAAVEALGQIATPAAADALDSVVVGYKLRYVAEKLNSVYRAQLTAADTLAREGHADRAESIYADLTDPALPEAVRMGAMRGLVVVRGPGSASMLRELLDAGDKRQRGFAAKLIHDVPGQELTTALANGMDRMGPAGRVYLIKALADRGDRAALPAIVEAVDDDEMVVRLTAINALGTLGDASAVGVLAEKAGMAEATQSHAAAQSLRTLRGDGVDEAIANLLPTTSEPGRIALIQTLADRGASSQASALPRYALSDDEGESNAALAALERIATDRELPALVDMLLVASDPAGHFGGDVRDKAEQAVVATCLRIPDKDKRAWPIVAAMRSADRASSELLLRVMSRIGGDKALEAVRTAMEQGELRAAAVEALANWPDTGAAADLQRLANFSSNPDEHALAFRGYVRLVGMQAGEDPAGAVEALGRVWQVTFDRDERVLVLDALGRIADPSAMKLAMEHLGDAETTESAAGAVLSIAKTIGDEHQSEAMAGINRVLAVTDNESIITAAGETANHVQRREDFITKWTVAGPYTKPGVNGSAIFNEAFPPEQDGGDWKPFPLTNPPGVFNLLTIGSPNNCCAYVKTRIWSDESQPARLEIGSDDGLKVWLNGDVVHANNAMRGLRVGEDQFTVTLDKGWNTLMLKITQGGGDWQYSCRIRSPQGFHLEGVKVGEE